MWMLSLLAIPKAQATDIRIEAPWHHTAYGYNGGAFGMIAELSNEDNIIEWVRFYVDGQMVEGDVDPVYRKAYCQPDWSGVGNPSEHQVYALARIRNEDSGGVWYENIDTRAAQPGGNGRTIKFGLANLQVQGLKWQGRLCDVYDHVAQVNRPNATNLYHWFQQTATSQASGFYPAVYLKGNSPQLEIKLRPTINGDMAIRALAHVAIPSNANYPFNGTSATFAGDTGTLSLPALDDVVNAHTASLEIRFQARFGDGTWATVYPDNPSTFEAPLYTVYAQP